jgi:E3 ubiquitin-protein ligase RFWD3
MYNCVRGSCVNVCQLCEMAQGNVGEGTEESYCTSHDILSVNGGSTQTLLSRSCLARHPVEQDRLLVCAGDEASSTVSDSLCM